MKKLSPSNKIKFQKKQNEVINQNIVKIFDYSMFILFMAFISILTTFKLFLDDDVFWHLATGRFIIQNGYVPLADVFGFITAGTKWIPFEWGWDVLAYLIYQIGGFYSLSIFKTLIVSAIFILIIRLLRKSNVNNSFIILFSILLSFGLLTRFSIRPQIATYFFLILLVYIFYHYQKTLEPKKYFFIYFPLIFLIWANMHMGVLLGMAVFGLFVISEEIDFYIIQKRKKSADEIKKNKYLLYALLLSLVALLINPHFIGTYYYTFQHTQMQMLEEINEWKTPFSAASLSYYYVKIYLFFLISGIILIYYSFKTKKLFPSLLYVVIGIYSIQGIRFIFDYMLIIFCFWIIGFDYFLSKINIKNIKYGLVFKSLLIIFLLLLITNTANNKIYTDYLGNNFRVTGFGVNENFFPEKMIDFIRKENINKIGTKPFNNLKMGGYFIWNYPDSRDFIDSRNLNDNIYTQYKNIELRKPGFELQLENLGIDYVMYSAPYLNLNPKEIERNIISYLTNANDTWKLIYWDDRSFLFVKNIPKFSDLINKYEYKYISPFNIIFNETYIKENYRKTPQSVMSEINRKLTEEPEGKLINYIAGDLKSLK